MNQLDLFADKRPILDVLKKVRKKNGKYVVVNKKNDRKNKTFF